MHRALPPPPPGLLRYAGILTAGDRRRAEDLVAEAHLRVWRRPAAGQRIEDPRARLAATVRHLAAGPVRGKAVPDVPGGESDDPAAGMAETARMRRLLAQLPERWAHALWPAEVQGLPPGGIGARLGVRRGGGAAHRAREGLRPACLRACPGSPHRPLCAGHWAAPAGHACGRAGRRAGQRVERHLPHRADCRRRLALLRRADLGLAWPGRRTARWRCRPRCWGPRRASRGGAAASPGAGRAAGSPRSPAPASRPAPRAPRRTRTPPRRCSR